MISVIIVNWNGKGLLENCLNSLNSSTFKDYEVIVVDNASTDDSIIYISRNHPNVRIIKLNENYGFAKGCNEGIKHAQGKYIALLNNDTEVDPNWLFYLNEALEAHPKIGFCASKVLCFDQRDTIDSAGDTYTIAGTAHKIGHLRRMGEQYDKMKTVFGASASAAIYRKEMLDRIGLFDEDFIHGHEDVDISFRAQLAGYQCLYVPQAVVFHKITATMNKKSRKYVYYSQRNLEWVLIKNMPSDLLWKYAIHHIIYNVGAFLYYAKKGKIIPFFMAKYDSLRKLPKMLEKRKLIQAEKIVSSQYIESIMQKKWIGLKIRKVLR